MKIITSTGREDIAMVYLAEMQNEKFIEFVESLQPPLPIEKKWVLIVSTMFGCPVGCLMCDAGGHFKGKLTSDEILTQIDFLIRKRFPDGYVPSEKFKIQFSRMGEPALNLEVINTLRTLPNCYDAKGLIPSISTVAPTGCDRFFEDLLLIKKEKYSNGKFQLQFSIHTTDIALRDVIVPIKKWDFSKIAEYGEEFYEHDDRKITLNFALAKDMPLDPGVLSKYFSPEKFLIKITPVNPTYRAVKNHLFSYINPSKSDASYQILDEIISAGYEVITSIGNIEENYIGSNCGQYVNMHLTSKERIEEGYKYIEKD
ncbi:MAG: radical SAM protein [Fervidobacterium sp.]